MRCIFDMNWLLFVVGGPEKVGWIVWKAVGANVVRETRWADTFFVYPGLRCGRLVPTTRENGAVRIY
jgi:hypothetical protein